MNRLIFSSFLILVSVGSFAQNNLAKSRTPEQRAEHITNWMDKKLSLTADQKSKIYAVNLKYAKLNQGTRANDEDNQGQMHQELKANENEREEEFKSILTPDQFQAFQTAKKELVQMRIERRKRD